MELFDSHAHLGYRGEGHDTGVEPGESPRRDAVDAEVREAEAAGVTRIAHIGAAGSLDACERAVALAERYERVWATLGFHPHEASSCTTGDLAAIEQMAAHPKVRAIGETGLDYHYMRSPQEVQREVFRQHLRLAVRVGLPVIVHSREADEDTVAILREEGADRCGGVIHCFSTTWLLAEAALELGFYVSFSGILTFRAAQPLREMAQRVPVDRLMVETDAPFLAPIPHRGKRNRPAWVVETARCLAEVRGVELETLAPTLTANTMRFYRVE